MIYILINLKLILEMIFFDQISRLVNKKLVTLSNREMKLTQLGIEWHTNAILEFFNATFWAGDTFTKEAN